MRLRKWMTAIMKIAGVPGDFHSFSGRRWYESPACYAASRCLTISCSASSIRVCQPLPVDRKCSTTFSESRSVICFFVGAFCGPRVALSSFFCRPCCKAENGTASSNIWSVHSGFSSSIISGSGFFRTFIFFNLPLICFTKADYSESIVRFFECERINPAFNFSK